MTVQDLKDRLALPLIPFYIPLLRRRKQASRTLQEHIRIVESARLGTLHIKPIQVRSELEQFMMFLSEYHPRNILEIGTARGGTLYLLAQVAAPNAQIVSLDLPGGAFGKGYADSKIPLFQSFANAGQTIQCVRADSHNPTTRSTVEQLFNHKPLDFLFIDGDHTYEGVAQDFEMYAPLVKPEGLIAFHDIVPGPSGRVGGVPQFWSETKPAYEHREIVADWNQGGYGIGLIWQRTRLIS